MRKPVKFIFKLLLYLFLGTIVILAALYSLASYYKKDLLEYFNTEIDNGITGSAHLNDISFTIFQQFPSVSVTLLGVTIKDSVYDSEIINAEKVFLQVHLLKLLRKEIDIKSIVLQNARFNIFKDSLGYSNLSVFAKKSPTDSTSKVKSSLMDFSLKRILFKNVELTYLDNRKKKRIHLNCEDIHVRFRKEEKDVLCHLNGRVFTEGLLFNNLKGPFLENKRLDLNLELNYQQDDSLLSLLPSTIETDGQKYTVEGRSKLNQKFPLIFLNIQTSDTDYDKAVSILNKHLQKVLNKFHVDKGLSCQVKLILDTKPGIQPFAHVNFQTKNSKVRVTEYFIENVTLQGSFNNHSDTTQLASDENSTLNIESGDFNYNEINIQIKGALHNLTNPVTNMDATFKGQLSALHHYLDTSYYKFSEGLFSVEIRQNGPFSLIDIPDPVMMKGHLEGAIQIEKGHLDIVRNKFDIAEINAAYKFLNSDVTIQSFGCKLNGNQLNVHGNLKNLVPFLLFPDKSITAKVFLSSPYINLNKLLIKGAGNKDKRPKTSKPLMGHLHKILASINLHLETNIKRLEYKKLVTGAITGNVEITKDAFYLKDWILNLPPKGRINLNASYLFQDNDSGKVTVDTKLKDVDAPVFFNGFDNFGQKTLTSANLAGIINAKIKFNCQTNASFEPVQKTIKGNMSLVLTEGQLKNFEPLRKLGKIVFKDRDLMHIHFDKINNVFILEGEELYIEKMVVNSSVLSLYLEGVYSFRHKTDLSIQIPLSNLKDPKNEFVKIRDVEHGNLRLRAKEKEGKMNIGIDLFNRYHKK